MPSLLAAGRSLSLALLIATAAVVPVSGNAVAHPHDYDGRTAYVFSAPGSNASTMRGTTQDWERVQRVRAGREGILYLRFEEGAYIMRDAATLAEAARIFEPQRLLGEQQSALGERQSALGRRQAALGAQQSQLGVRQANATARQVGELGRQQGVLGQQQSALGAQQALLGEEQAALGRRQAQAAREAEPKLRALLTDSIRRGVAQRVD